MIVFKIPLTALVILRTKVKEVNLKKSTNAIYAGEHWAKRANYKDVFTGHAEKFCRFSEEIGSWPVSIRYRFIFESIALDALNCSYMAKVAEDALRAFGILPDDTPRYVAEAILTSSKAPAPTGPGATKKDRKKHKEDYLIIEISPYVNTNQGTSAGVDQVR